MEYTVLPGAQAWSTTGSTTTGALVLHGFTGNPTSMRSLAEALAAAGHSVELPRLPGHGTSIDEMLTTGWADWSQEVASAYERLAARCERIVVIGLSMGGALTIWSGLNFPQTAGLVCINPATRPQAPEILQMLNEALADGMAVMPGIGSDIADPDSTELAYEGMPVQPLLSFMDEGLAPMVGRYGEIRIPLLLFTSRQDHVVDPGDSEYLAAAVGGPVDHHWLERSYHVATQDYDRDYIVEHTLAFVDSLSAS